MSQTLADFEVASMSSFLPNSMCLYSVRLLAKPAARTVAALLMSIAVISPLATVGCGWQFSIGADPLAIVTQPANVTIIAEQTAIFAVVATDDVPLTYQWYKGGIAIQGATSNTYLTPAMPLTTDGSQFTVTVSDGTVSRSSGTAVLTVKAKPAQLVLQPVPAFILGAAPFPVAASSNSPGPISYSILSGSATISSNIVTVLGMGPVVVGASQLPSGDYTGAATSTNFMVREDVSISPITPGNLTMGPGTQPFSANATGGTTNKVAWSANGGSFSGSVWTSPDVAGKYTIMATSVDDPRVSASTSMIVSPPIITQQPIGGSFCANSNFNMTVAALYADSFHWSLNGKPLNGAVNPAYAAVANAAVDAGQYTAAATNRAGTALSDPANIAVGSSISTNPQSITVADSQTGSFSASATGVGPFAYQWYVVPAGGSTGILIPGATSNSYTTPPVNRTHNGNKYYAIVQDACNLTLTTTSASLTVTGLGVPPTIIVPPVSQSVTPGAAAIFSVQAEGTPMLTYQWFWAPAGSGSGGTAIYGATAAKYSLPSSATTLANDQDQYYVVVQNAYGQAASPRATLSVGAGILITQQPVSAYIQSGGSAAYTVAATSTLPLSYQWYEASPGTSTFTPIQGATSTTYMIANGIASQSSSDFYVIVSNGVTASVRSNTASLFVGPLSSISPCEGGWNVLGNTVQLDNCTYELTAPAHSQGGELVWPSLIGTDNLQLSFTIATSNSTPVPADGFAVVLGDPSLGATVTSVGSPGEGLGARGIPGLVIAFDVYQNNFWPGLWPQDPTVPYLGIGRGEDNLWESPYFNVNSTIAALTTYGETISHNYVLTLHQGSMSMTMDGNQIFSGGVSVSPTAYLYITGSTGGGYEKTVVSNISAVVKAP